MSYIYTTTKDSRNIPISDKRNEKKQKRTEHTQQYLRKGTYINNKWQLEKYYLKMQKNQCFLRYQDRLYLHSQDTSV